MTSSQFGSVFGDFYEYLRRFMFLSSLLAVNGLVFDVELSNFLIEYYLLCRFVLRLAVESLTVERDLKDV